MISRIVSRSACFKNSGSVAGFFHIKDPMEPPLVRADADAGL